VLLRDAAAETRARDVRHKVFLYLLEQFTLLDVVGPLQVFAAADELLVARGGVPAYKAQLYGAQAGAVASASGVVFQVDAVPQRLGQAPGSLIFVGGSQGLLRLDAQGARRDPASDWTRDNLHRFARVASVGKDAFLLVHSARARSRPLATRSEDRGQQSGPLQPRAVLQPQRWMSVNASVGMELALAMVHSDLGEGVALEIAETLAQAYGRRILVRLGGSFTNESNADRRLDDLHSWIEEHLREPLSVPRLAKQMAMTPRTFARHYERATGGTPAQAVLRLRLERACMLIASSPNLTLKAISLQCGFSSEEVMRRAFLRCLHLSPKAYRRELLEEAAAST
jgi:transcriptional regulator GlxA family with amidase domain